MHVSSWYCLYILRACFKIYLLHISQSDINPYNVLCPPFTLCGIQGIPRPDGIKLLLFQRLHLIGFLLQFGGARKAERRGPMRPWLDSVNEQRFCAGFPRDVQAPHPVFMGQPSHLAEEAHLCSSYQSYFSHYQKLKARAERSHVDQLVN